MKKRYCLILFVFSLFVCRVSSNTSDNLPYKDSKLSSHERVLDLLSRMTLEEKVGQLLCPLGWEMYDRQGDEVTYSEKFKDLVQNKHIGMLWAVYRADPWTKKTIENGLSPTLAAKVGNALQRYVLENTRLGIPLFIAEEAPHGHMAIGGTVFPSGIGQASTWNPVLLEKMGGAISKEIRSQGAHISYGPVLDLVRDARWSRVEETFGEDPVLAATLGAAIAKGNGKGQLNNPYSTITTLKHFIAYGIPEGGHNGNTALVGNREIHENFLPPFKKAIEAGALSVMTAYNSVDGIPCTANSDLLKNILKDKWNFGGFVVSDLVSVDGLKEQHLVSKSLEDAGVLALSSGVDVDLGFNSFSLLGDAFKNGKINMSDIDSAVYRVLKLKFDMGLFENPYVKIDDASKNVKTKEHISLARQLAQESIVLLENKKQTLPLSKKNKIAVIGPNADNPYNMLGDYTAPQNRKDIITVLDGIKSKIGGSRVEYVKGCAIRDTTDLSIKEAVEAALRADVAVVVVGGSSARDFKTKYIETGAAISSTESLSDMESGEGFDRSSLELMGKQLELLKAIKATGKPIIVVYIQGRPLNMNWAHEYADALLTGWYPGQEGGAAIANVLFGDYNPAGRLPISVPRSVGQIPVYYNRKNPWGHDYVEMTSKPLYSFGYGLSYTQFEYTNMTTKQLSLYDFEVSCVLKNTGKYDGEEVVQLYVKDEFASLVQPVKQLKHFERVFLKKGEEKLITFHLNKDDLSILDKNLEQVVEPGDFTLMVGSSSDNIKLEKRITVNPKQAILTDEFIYDINKVSFPSVHSATIEETPAGLVSAFFGGEYEGHPEVSIYVSRRVGSEWTSPVKVVDGIVNDSVRKACYNPVLFQVQGKELILFYKIGYNVQDWSGYLIRSFDNGLTWTKPEALPEGFLGPIKNRPLLVDETLICGSSTENDGWKVHFEFTNDLGKMWTKTNPINDKTCSIIQPSILQHKDGTLQTVCRSQNEAVVSSFSSDKGKTWTKSFPLHLPNNNSGLDAIALADGRFLMVYNHVKASQSAYMTRMRTPLNVAVSNDGIHWDNILVLEDSPIKEYSYPSVIQDKKGIVHIVYTWRRENVKYVEIDPSQLYVLPANVK